MDDATRRSIVALNRDVFFGVRLKQLGQELGYDVTIVPDAPAFLDRLLEPSVALGIIDINARPNWTAITEGSQGADLAPILAFGPHLDVDGLRAAKAAGVTRVVSNGRFHRDAAALIERYASGGGEFPEEDDIEEIDDH